MSFEGPRHAGPEGAEPAEPAPEPTSDTDSGYARSGWPEPPSSIQQPPPAQIQPPAPVSVRATASVPVARATAPVPPARPAPAPPQAGPGPYEGLPPNYLPPQPAVPQPPPYLAQPPHHPSPPPRYADPYQPREPHPFGQPPTGQIPTGQIQTAPVPLGRAATASGRVTGSAAVPGQMLVQQQPGVAQPPAPPPTSRVYGRPVHAPAGYPEPAGYPDQAGRPPAYRPPTTERALAPITSAPPVGSVPPMSPARGKPRRGLLVIGIAGAVVVVLLAVGVFFFVRGSGTGDPFPVGSCVKQAGGSAVAARCTDAGAFTVVSKVDSVEECTDKSQPYLQLTGTETNGILCLAPAVGSGGPGPSPTTTSGVAPSSTVD